MKRKRDDATSAEESSSQEDKEDAQPFAPSHEVKEYLFADSWNVVHERFTGTRAEMTRFLAELNKARPKGRKLQGVNPTSPHGQRMAAAAAQAAAAQVAATSSAAAAAAAAATTTMTTSSLPPREGDEAITVQRGRAKLARTKDISPDDILALHRLRSERPDLESYLNLKGSGLGASHVGALVAAWRGSRGQFSQLGLTDNKLGPNGCESLVAAMLESEADEDQKESSSSSSSSSRATNSTSTTIEALYLSRNCVGARGGAALASLLRSPACRCLRLGLNFNALGDEGACLLASALPHQLIVVENPLRRLKVLGLSGNGLTNAAANLFADVLTPTGEGDTNAPALERLFMGDNKIGDEGAERLALMLTSNKNLKRLVSDEGPPSICFVGF
jgi:hypothetical protein